MKLDLHGLKHQDVKRQLDVFFWEAMNKKVGQVEVVTGHSHVMKQLKHVMNMDSNSKKD